MFKWVSLAFGLVATALVVTYQILGDAGAGRPARLAVALTGGGLAVVWAALWVVHKAAGQRDRTAPPAPDDSRPAP